MSRRQLYDPTYLTKYKILELAPTITQTDFTTILRQILASGHEVERITVNGSGLISFPVEIRNFIHLRCVTFESMIGINRSVTLDSTIGYLQQITSLCLKACQLTSLPENFSSLKNLKYLDLKGNQFTTFPLVIRKLPKLTELVFSQNLIDQIPYMNSSSLQSLDFSDNRILSIHFAISLPKLVTCDLSYNRLTSFPQFLKECRGNLNHLNLNRNQLTTLPDLELIGLTYLELKKNRLTTLGTLYLPNLTVLDLSSNNLTNLNDVNLNFLERLIDISLDKNGLTQFPESLFDLTALEDLNLKSNQITVLPREITRLQKLENLFLGNNQLRFLPTEVSLLTRLDKLWVEDNLLERIDIFPPNVTVINLANNKLNQLPDQIGDLHSLEELNVESNQLTTLPFSIRTLRQLETLILTDNPLVLPPILQQFIEVDTFADPENIHSSPIIRSARASLEKILTQENPYDPTVLKQIAVDPDLTPACRDLLLQYSRDKGVDSVLQITFLDTLGVIYPYICRSADPISVKAILSDEMEASRDTCFTGRIVRLINVLNGIHPDVQIQISESQEIQNLVSYINSRYKEEDWSERKVRIIKALEERGISPETIRQWTEDI